MSPTPAPGQVWETIGPGTGHRLRVKILAGLGEDRFVCHFTSTGAPGCAFVANLQASALQVATFVGLFGSRRPAAVLN